jgi:hypothetical protein
MRSIIDWILDDKQHNLFEFLVALTLNVLFLLLIIPLLWPLNSLRMVFDLAQGYGLLWLIMLVTAALLDLMQRVFRLNLYDHFNAYVLSTLAVNCALLVGWSAFAALTAHKFVPDLPVWRAALVYLAGGLSCPIASFVTGSIYQGTIYKLASLPVVLVSFLIFSIWPDSVRTILGWFF